MGLRAHLHQVSCVKRHASRVIDAGLVFIGAYDAIHTKRFASCITRQHDARLGYRPILESSI